MPTVNLLTWNIQNFGPTKSGINYNNTDVVEAIAKEVADTGADIFCLLELNTTHNATAAAVAGILLNALNAYANSQGRNEWNTCVLSPNTGLEFYAFFVRDTAFTIPMPITGPVGAFGAPSVLGGGLTALTAGVFTGSTAAGVLAQRFPLLVPDLAKITFTGRNVGVPVWPAVRAPVLGVFWVPTAAAGSRLLPIWACHFAANTPQASSQIGAMRWFSLLWKLNPTGAPPVQLQVDPNATGAPAAVATNQYVVTGDFNIDYLLQPWLYAPLDQAGPRWLNATEWTGDETHLVTYGNYSRKMTTTGALAVNAYDNFFTGVNAATAAAVTPANPAVYDVPGDVRNRRLRLGASVQHYAELDQRGFVGGAYQNFVTDYAAQIAGDPSHLITVKGALVGGRLISDHLPIELQITL